ncbi:fimbrial protein [Citrobacter amalonaticus]|uniref:fimbrial protein n=1 Tax=Citrobacter amalonaticus TaxID=35703 RepID=UPI0016509C2E|nr:fimbrial protein [Citrobacter amalonaticus]MBC6532978.1 fimbrial protein [Citrobacter amalonaticus]
MCKFIFALFIVLLSICSLPTMAANCSGGTILFDTDPSDHGYWMNGYTSANDDPLLIMQVTVQNGMTCDADYIDIEGKMSNMVMNVTSGGTCKNSTIITTPYPGIEWRLEGMTCDGSSIISNNVKAMPWDGRANWPAGTVLGKAKLVVTDQYWMQNTQEGRYTINIQPPSIGNTLVHSPAVNVRSGLGGTIPFIFQDNATCSMSLSTENLDFGRLTPNDVNGNSLYKELKVYYSCKNKALVNGLYIRFDPENVVDAANGMFSASDRDGRKLNFQISRLYGNYHIVPLNTNYKAYEPTKDNLDNTATFRINVKPSTPFPAGKVSTYMNVSLIYR